MVNLVTLQDKINTKLSDNRTKEQKLRSLALNRLSLLYKEQSDSIDDIIDNISKSIDMEDIDYTYKLIIFQLILNNLNFAYKVNRLM